MILLDANILLYAYNTDAPQHHGSAQWLRRLLASGEIIGLPTPTLWAFIRISTNSRLWQNPLTADYAFSVVRQWLEQPGVTLVQPGPRHLELLQGLVTKYNAGGALVSDAVLAALAIEYGAVLASTDQDFRRFPSVQWLDPLSDDAGQ